MGKNTLKNKSHKSAKLHKAVKYTHSTVDYAGLVSWSIITRCSNTIKSSALKTVRPVVRNATEPFTAVKNKKWKLFGKKVDLDIYKKIKEIEEANIQLRKRLAFLEKHGVTRISTAAVPKKEKILSDDKRFVLKEILEDTKALRGTE